MDEINDFFDFSKPSQRVSVRAGYINGRIVSDSSGSDIQLTKREDCDKNYAEPYQKAETQQIFNNTTNSSYQMSRDATMEEAEDLESVISEMEVFEPKVDRVYEKYTFNDLDMDHLPISEMKVKILTGVRENPAVVLQGETGCGKTTQVPLYILSEAARRKERCNIICTQPRRIAAISIANRVCSEQGWQVGDLVGYQVGLHSKSSEDTRLLYCTTGILLQKLIKTKKMSKYTHIILDEVHERSTDMDFLLIIVRRLLVTNSQHTKVILMSATIQTNVFSEYFSLLRGSSIPVPAPIIRCDKKRLHAVDVHYLSDLEKLKISDEIISYDDPGITEEMYNLALRIVSVCTNIADPPGILKKPSILIFLPGVNEIEKMHKTLDIWCSTKKEEEKELLVLRLHSTIPHEEQQRIFRNASPGIRKVILATNIAESSITVPDVGYVIDFCLMKSLRTDTCSNLSSLKMHWCSKSNCIQRAGRTGRVSKGKVYRLVARQFYDNHMRETAEPEMLRCPLEIVVLNAKMLDFGPPHTILALAMDPPELTDIRNTILILKEIGALYKTVNDCFSEFDGDLTFMGRIMAALPVDVRITRLIVFGYCFNLLEEAIIIGAGLNALNVFEIPSGKELEAYNQKLNWADGSGSDLIAIYNAYKIWRTALEQGQEDETEKAWGRRFYVNVRRMHEIHLLIEEIQGRLTGIGIQEIAGARRVNWTDKEKTIILKIIISGAFYPNYFIRSASHSPDYERDAYMSLGGRDPCNTIYFSGFDQKFLGILYVQAIKDMLRPCCPQTKRIRVSFDRCSQKVYVTFVREDDDTHSAIQNRTISMPGKVYTEIYKAVKMRKLRKDFQLRVMNRRDAIEYATEKGLGALHNGMWVTKVKHIQNPELVVLPNDLTKTIRGKITHIEHCGKFWLLQLSEELKMKEIIEQLNGLSSDIWPFRDPSQISKDMMLAALKSEPGGNAKYHRAKIVSFENRGNSDNVAFKVFFIDFGCYAVTDFVKLRKFGPQSTRLRDIPPRVFECCLTEVQPSSINCPSGIWPDEAINLMQEFLCERIVEVEIYSVVYGIASVVVRQSGDSFNDLLIEKAFGQKAEENFLSKSDHERRVRKQRVAEFYDVETNYDAQEDYLTNLYYNDNEVPVLPPPSRCKVRIDLKGPHSPLESKAYAITKIGSWKRVEIERNSVNSVLLNNNPQDSNERYIVAAAVGQIVERAEITARETTLMPNINGFGALMGMIFCPTMEIRRDKNKTKYVSILTGLGSDEKGRSLFEEHDMVFNLDVQIDLEDLEMINQIRYSMDSLLHTYVDDEIPSPDESGKIELHWKMKSLLIRLLEKKRKLIEVHPEARSFAWGNCDKHDLLKTPNTFGNRSIFPYHWGLKLYKETFENSFKLSQHCKELHRMARHETTVKPIECKLCKQQIQGLSQLRVHLLSQLHRDRESQIHYEADE